MTKEAPLVRNGKEISHVKQKEIFYRITKKVDVEKEELKQILVPKDLRKKVMEVTHDTMLARHIRFKKTEDRIQTNFYWTGMHQDVVSFCRSCPEDGIEGECNESSAGENAVNGFTI